ncbi:MAG: DUF86 domain-containing protein [Nitrospirae bacterium]|nr:DUF86 domain-containing protein [Nitrospirota bacterium]
MSYKEYLKHILDEAEYISSKSKGITKNAFLKDETLKRAFVRSIEIIGEAVKRLPDDFRQKHSNVDWRVIAGTRDKLIHDYMGIDYDIVWDIVTDEIPQLRKHIKIILKNKK